jgi:hypothetical protein
LVPRLVIELLIFGVAASSSDESIDARLAEVARTLAASFEARDGRAVIYPNVALRIR